MQAGDNKVSAAQQDWQLINDRLVALLKPYGAPVAISFLAEGEAAPVARLDDKYPKQNESGRTGQVPAGCVFWIRGGAASFATTASDHANCSVGSLTHGFLTFEEAARKDDIGAVLESGWADEAMVRQLPVVTNKPGTVVYGPLAESQIEPDVVLVRINGLACADAFEGRVFRPSDRRKVAVSHHRHCERTRSRCCQCWMRAQPFSNWYESGRDDLRHSRQTPWRTSGLA